MTDDELLDMVQEYTFRYFWDFAHPTSGLAYEYNTDSITSGQPTTSGGTGFGIMAILVGIERGFITRQQGVERIEKIVNFLEAKAEKFYGAFSHWMDGETGKVIPFSEKDDGADLVETSLLLEGLLTAKEYFDKNNAIETRVRTQIQTLWEGIQWNKFREKNASALFWHWSPNHGFGYRLKIQGWSETLITYLLAISSPTHKIPPSMYKTGWTRNGDFKNGKEYYNIPLLIGDKAEPLFFTHYSFLGLDPSKIGDQYTDSYYEQGRNQTLINRQYCIENPNKYPNYSYQCWGLTASQTPPPDNYKVHKPNSADDNGTISPTAAISSMPYTPEESLEALKYFYRSKGNLLWGPMGFYDAFNESKKWTSDNYLAIDQGPILLMIENYRSKLLWKNFMKNSDLRKGLASIPSLRPIDYDYGKRNNNTIRVLINDEEKLRVDIGEEASKDVSLISVKAVVGDELTIEVYDTSAIPEIKGLPDLWIARAFINEGIFMSSKSITPGAYKPWIPYATVSHSTLALPYSNKWLNPKEYESNRYPKSPIAQKTSVRWLT